MATISSHVLDSVRGDHARGIRVDCFRRANGTSGASVLVFSVIADDSGRISETVAIDDSSGQPFELVFHTAAYFSGFNDDAQSGQIMPEVSIKITVSDPDARYHLPLVLSPHSYTVWWSGVTNF